MEFCKSIQSEFWEKESALHTLLVFIMGLIDRKTHKSNYLDEENIQPQIMKCIIQFIGMK